MVLVLNQGHSIKLKHVSIGLTTNKLYLELMKEWSLLGTAREELGRRGTLTGHISCYLHGHVPMLSKG